MSIPIGSHNFDGPFTEFGNLLNKSGVYVILGGNDGTNWAVVDVGESGGVWERVVSHEREPCWRGQGHRTLAAAVHYADEATRMKIERDLRNEYDPPCGKR